MAYEFYKAYINSMAQSPKDDWREMHQQATDDFWDNTSTVATISGQTAVGLLTYADENVQLNSVINPTTGENFGDQYRKIIYKNYIEAESQKWLGKMYQFESGYWLVTNTNTVLGANQSAILRKCNNMLKWYDKDGILNQWQCVFTRNVSGSSFDYGVSGVPQVEGDCKILVQLNKATATIPFNQRFLFNGHAFQVRQIDNHYSDTLLTIYIFETQIQSNDDLVNNIAGGSGQITPTTSENKILPNTTKIILGQTINYNVYNYVNGVKTADTFAIVASGVPIEAYTLTLVDGNNFTIKNNIKQTIPLMVTCTNNTSSVATSIEIILGGIW